MRRQDGALLSVSVTVIHCHLHPCFHWQINWTYSFRYFLFVFTILTFPKHQTNNVWHVSHPSSSLPKLLFTPSLYSVVSGISYLTFFSHAEERCHLFCDTVQSGSHSLEHSICHSSKHTNLESQNHTRIFYFINLMTYIRLHFSSSNVISICYPAVTDRSRPNFISYTQSVFTTPFLVARHRLRMLTQDLKSLKQI
jgi:hypothetical protein